MLKILYTISTLQRSGPSLVVYNLVQGLDRKKFVPMVLTLSKEPKVSLKKDFEKLRVEVCSLALSRIGGLLVGVPKFLAMVKKLCPDIIHAQGFRDICLTALAGKKYTKIATIHCDFRLDYRLKYGAVFGSLMAWLQWRALRRFSKRVCVSRTLSAALNNNAYGISFDYIENGVDMRLFYPVSDKKTLRKELGLPEDKIIFIWAGSFIKMKNPMLLVRLIKNLTEKNLFFVFCGARGALLQKARQEAGALKNVLFTGYTEHIAQYMQASDCYISTSVSEGFHLAAYEALACGLPVILTKLDVYREMEDLGQALFFPNGDGEGLRGQISYFLQHQESFAPRQGECFVKEKFSSDAMSKRYQQFYEGMRSV